MRMEMSRTEDQTMNGQLESRFSGLWTQLGKVKIKHGHDMWHDEVHVATRVFGLHSEKFRGLYCLKRAPFIAMLGEALVIFLFSFFLLLFDTHWELKHSHSICSSSCSSSSLSSPPPPPPPRHDTFRPGARRWRSAALQGVTDLKLFSTTLVPRRLNGSLAGV